MTSDKHVVFFRSDPVELERPKCCLRLINARCA